MTATPLTDRLAETRHGQDAGDVTLIEPRDLRITRPGRGRHLLPDEIVYIREYPDLGVLLDVGQKSREGFDHISHGGDGEALVVLSLGVDREHDDIRFELGYGRDAVEVLTNAIEVLTAGRDALASVTGA